MLPGLGAHGMASVEDQLWAEALAARVANEVWRLGRRVKDSTESSDDDSLRAIRDSVSRLEDILLEHQIEIREHQGERYDPGLQVEVLHDRDGQAPQYILETIRPTVTLRGRILQQAQVVIGAGNPKEADR